MSTGEGNYNLDRYFLNFYISYWTDQSLEWSIDHWSMTDFEQMFDKSVSDRQVLLRFERANLQTFQVQRTEGKPEQLPLSSLFILLIIEGFINLLKSTNIFHT